MDEKRESKKSLFDLTGNNLELDKSFDSVINRLPDLCMPPSYRLAGEDDFFNCTKDLKLKPFRKQKVFETCISPELFTGSAAKSIRCDGARLTSPRSASRLSRTPTPIHERKASTNDTTRPITSVEKDSKNVNNKRRTKKSKEQVELERKRALRETLKKKYSNLSVKKHNKEETDHRIGYDRLFTSAPASDYPFANPIPSCMMTDDNIDNLREIIVSAVDIEWKMLTPVRPPNEYEEKFFDRLIQLHRCRYKMRLETGYFEAHQTIPFKHIRHTYLVRHDDQLSRSLKAVHQVGPSTTSVVGATGSKVGKARKQTLPEPGKELAHPPFDSSSRKPNIPTLTLTSDGVHSERIVHRASIAPVSRDNEFNYVHYSRFSKRNLRNGATGSRPLQAQQAEMAVPAGPRNQEVGSDTVGAIDDRVEEILSSLVNVNLDQ